MEWVSINSSMPPQDEYIDVYIKYAGMSDKKGKRIVNCIFDGEHIIYWGRDDCPIGVTNFVTHWMLVDKPV